MRIVFDEYDLDEIEAQIRAQRPDLPDDAIQCVIEDLRDSGTAFSERPQAEVLSDEVCIRLTQLPVEARLSLPTRAKTSEPLDR